MRMPIAIRIELLFEVMITMRTAERGHSPRLNRYGSEASTVDGEDRRQRVQPFASTQAYPLIGDETQSEQESVARPGDSTVRC